MKPNHEPVIELTVDVNRRNRFALLPDKHTYKHTVYTLPDKLVLLTSSALYRYQNCCHLCSNIYTRCNKSNHNIMIARLRQSRGEYWVMGSNHRWL